VLKTCYPGISFTYVNLFNLSDCRRWAITVGCEGVGKLWSLPTSRLPDMEISASSSLSTRCLLLSPMFLIELFLFSIQYLTLHYNISWCILKYFDSILLSRAYDALFLVYPHYIYRYSIILIYL
jgi:hypothetical protein